MREKVNFCAGQVRPTECCRRHMSISKWSKATLTWWSGTIQYFLPLQPITGEVLQRHYFDPVFQFTNTKYRMPERYIIEGANSDKMVINSMISNYWSSFNQLIYNMLYYKIVSCFNHTALIMLINCYKLDSSY